MNTTFVAKEELAIYGGKPIRDKLLPYGRQQIDEEDIAAVADTLRSDWLTTGPKVNEFEEAFAARVGAKYAVSFSSGTAALHGAAFAAGIETGDEAITSPLTFAATPNSVLYQGGRPVFADIRPDTLNIDPEYAARCITPRTKAILPVDYAGHPADLDEIGHIAEHHGLTIIEDACHALGAEYRGSRVGSISHMTIFSFHPVKHLTTGEGGMVTTDNPQFANALRKFRNHGISADAHERQARGQWEYEMVLLGYNYRLTDIACALGLRQLSKLEQNLQHRRQIAKTYSADLNGVPGILLPAVLDYVAPAWHLYSVQLDLQKMGANRAEIFRALRAENIGVNVHYIPAHFHPYYRQRFGYHGGEFPVVEAAYERLITLPLFHGMSEEDVEDVVSGVKKVMNCYTD